jgi:hypothetical protein
MCALGRVMVYTSHREARTQGGVPDGMSRHLLAPLRQRGERQPQRGAAEAPGLRRAAVGHRPPVAPPRGDPAEGPDARVPGPRRALPHRGTGPPRHQTGHPAHAGVQSVLGGARHSGGDRTEAHDHERAVGPRWAARAPARRPVLGVGSRTARVGRRSSSMRKMCDSTTS